MSRATAAERSVGAPRPALALALGLVRATRLSDTSARCLVLALAVFLLAAPPVMAQPTIGVRLGEIETELGRLMNQLEQEQQASARAATEMEALGEQRSAAERRLVDRGRALYRLRRIGVLPLAGGFPAMLSHASRLERLERMVLNDLDAVDELGRRRLALRAQNARLATSGEQVERRIRELQSEKVALEAEQRSAELFSDVFTQSHDPFPPSANGYGLTAVGSGGGPPFAHMRGRLVMPVAGAMHIVDAGDGTTLSFRVPPGTHVRAASEGRVVYAAPYGPSGVMVVLDHGDAHFTVYRGLASSAVAVGQLVSSAAHLGEVAYAQEGLQFEVRNGPRPLSAREWLGL